MVQEMKQVFIKKWWAWIALFLIIMIGFTILNEEPEKNAIASEQVDQPVQPEVINSAIGKPIVIGDVVYTIKSTETVTSVGNESNVLNAKGEFVVFDVEIKNESKGAIITDPSIFKLRRHDVQFESDGAAGINLNGGGGFYMQLLNPGLSLNGKIAFDIPQHTDNLVLYIVPGQGKPVGIVKIN
jgi:hypothetical protein